MPCCSATRRTTLDDRRGDRRRDRPFGGDDRARAERHEARAGVLDVSQLGYMFLAMGVGAYAARHLSPVHPRVLQGPAVPRVRRGDSRAVGRAGSAADGRPETRAADHLLDVPDRRAGDLPAFPVCPGSSARTRFSTAPIAGGQTVLWAVGLLTSLLTAIYMFRRRVSGVSWRAAPAAGSAPQHPAPQHPAPQHPAPQHPAPRTHVHLHDAPPAMALALIVLAIGSVLPDTPDPALGGRSVRALSRAELRLPGARDLAESTRSHLHRRCHEGLELALMVVSIVAASAGSASRRSSS